MGERPDAGIVGTADTGVVDPLPLEAGMIFQYRGQLTFRDPRAGQEEDSQYQLTVEIVDVDDRGAGQASLRFSATGMQSFDRGWEPTADFDSWVARLGPSLPGDTVGAAPVTHTLDLPPRLPSPPQGGKTLPVAGSFFIDVRAIDDVRATFATENAARRPQVLEPDQSPAGRWTFATSGDDPDLFYYGDPPKTRSVRLEYDRRGFLVRIDETINDPASPPSGSFSLVLQSGP